VSMTAGGTMGASAPASGIGGAPISIQLNAYGINDPVQLVEMIDRELRVRGQAFARAS
jgi:hypothetical protein